jgi:putative ABC transport system permease protein
MGALNRKLLRDLARMKGQAFAIALVIASGIALFVMTAGLIDSLEVTRSAYYDRYRFADVFASVKRAPEHLRAEIEALPGVRRADTRIVRDVTLDVPGIDEPATGRLISLPAHGRPRLNDIVLQSGRLPTPGRSDEVVANERFALANGFEIGERIEAVINGTRRQLRITGTALSPEYVYAIAPGALMPDDRRFAVMWMGRDALAAAFDLKGAFNDLAVALERGALAEAVIERLDRMLARYGSLGAYGREDQTSNWFLSGEIRQLATMGRVLPTIFLAVAAFLLNMIITRLIATERDQIGLLKAFGYGNLAVGWHYLKLVMVLAGLGALLGCALGAWLGRLMMGIYVDLFSFPFLFYRPNPDVFVIAALITFAAALIGTQSALRRAIALPPAEAMRPPAPTRYRRGLDLPGLRRLLDQPSRMIFRHIGRWPVRGLLTSLGISFAVALLVTSFHWLDSIEAMIEGYFFQTQRQDLTVTLVEARSMRALQSFRRIDGVLAAEPFRGVGVKIRFGPKMRRESIIGSLPSPRLNRTLDAEERPLHIPESGLVLSSELARLIGAQKGDIVTIEVLEGARPTRRVVVRDIFETYIGTPIYMDIEALNRLMREGPTISGAYLLVDPAKEQAVNRALKDTPAVAGVTSREAAVTTFEDTLAETLNVTIFFNIMFGGLLAFGVVYNSARIALSERGRELASLRVLGFTPFEIGYILLGELGILTLAALPLGCALGYGLSAAITDTMSNELYRIPMVVDQSTYGIAMVVTLAAALLTAAIIQRRLQRLDLIAVLKTRE